MESLFASIFSLLSTIALVAAAPFAAIPLDASKFSDEQFNAGIAPIVSAHHSFGVSADQAGTLFFTEYTRGRIVRVNIQQGTTTPLTVSAQKAYALTTNAENTHYMTLDGDAKTGALRSITAQGVVKEVVSNLTRPRGVSIGSDGKVYVAIEGDNKLLRFDPASQKSEDALTGVQAPQAVIEKAGVLYWLERGTFSPHGEPLTAGKIRMKETTGITRTLVDGIWYARSMMMRPDGTIVFVSGANRSSQGNSGYIATYNPHTHEIALVRGGLDFPEATVLVGTTLYATLSRDNLLVAVTNETGKLWPEVSMSMIYEGAVLAEEDEGTDPFFIAIEGADTPLTGGIKDGPAGIVRGWFKLTIADVDIDRKEIPAGTLDTPTSGVFKTPLTSCKRESGASCPIMIIPERKRVNARWPVTLDAKKREIPQKSFIESPSAYWFYIDTHPSRDSLTRTSAQMSPSLQRHVQRHFEGLYQRKPKTFEEMVAWFANVRTNSLDCKAISNTFLSTDEWQKGIIGKSDEVIVKMLYKGLLGIDGDAVSLSRTLDMRKKGASWESVADDLMKTTQYQNLCVKDWY